MLNRISLNTHLESSEMYFIFIYIFYMLKGLKNVSKQNIEKITIKFDTGYKLSERISFIV